MVSVMVTTIFIVITWITGFWELMLVNIRVIRFIQVKVDILVKHGFYGDNLKSELLTRSAYTYLIS